MLKTVEVSLHDLYFQMGEKQKGRGTIAVPSTDQLRMAKLSIDSSDDASLQKLIKKVCSCYFHLLNILISGDRDHSLLFLSS